MNNKQDLQKLEIQSKDLPLKLDERLKTCCSFLRGRALADIGTDHAYLPAVLAATGKVPHAIASDIAEGPLRAAEKTLLEYGVEKLIELRKCDGLSGFLPGEAEDFVIAGMGGELIARILEAAPWLKAPGYRLVLQPMTQQPHLRRRLKLSLLLCDPLDMLFDKAADFPFFRSERRPNHNRAVLADLQRQGFALAANKLDLHQE